MSSHFRHADVNHKKGNDYIMHTKSTTHRFNKDDGTHHYTTVQITTTHAMIDSEGEIGDVSVTSEIYTYQNGEKPGNIKLDPKKINMSDAPSEFQNFAQGISAYKKSNKESPSQTQASDNKQTKSMVDLLAIPVGAGASSLSATKVASGFWGVTVGMVALAISNEIKIDPTEIGKDLVLENKKEVIKSKDVSYEY
ncbi:hypothetical protein [Pseudotenacibaculum haliotis]|uniref:Uncharacterized protein n=1 Tax=Pseudotenacibaculum haliotis TaxID=1862138 RepID=A0ABW5LVU1_9FLAO